MARRGPTGRRSDYHRLDVRAKERYARDRLREPAIACPACETQTTVRDLLQHLATRCPGRRAPHHLSEWVSWEEALAVAEPVGVRASLVRCWIDDGLVRADGERYLLRDLVQAIAARLVRAAVDSGRRR